MTTHIMVGLSHRQARVAELERFWVPPEQRGPMAEAIVKRGCTEAFVLSTCARTELHAMAEASEPSDVAVVVTEMLEILDAHGRDRHDRGGGAQTIWLATHAWAATGDEATTHLFRVAAGLEGRVFGEREIRTQVQDAALTAAASPGQHPHQLQALAAAAVGAARSIEVGAEAGPAAMVFARRAVDLAVPGEVAQVPTRVGVVGTGTIGRQIRDLLADRGHLTTVVARSAGQNGQHSPHARPGAQLGTTLRNCDVVVFATSARQRVLTKQVMRDVVRERAGRPITILDLALPRNVDPGVRQLPAVRLIDLDDVQGVAAGPRDRAAADRAVEDAARRYCSSVRARQAGPLIARMRGQLEQSCRRELRRHTSGLDLPEDTVHRAAAAIAGALAHTPTMLAREAAANDDPATLEVLAQVFNVAEAPPTTPQERSGNRRHSPLGRPRPAQART